MKKNMIQIVTVAFASVVLMSCDKHTPPKMDFKIGTGYLSSDADSVMRNTDYKVGITASKTEDDLKTYNISVAYDGGSSTTKLNASVSNSVDRDDIITTRNQAGTEKWSFTITDKDGNIATKSLTLKVK